MKDTKYPTPTVAVSLHYDGENAPRVTAKGQGDLADQILAVAKAHGIPLHEDRDLVSLLSKLELGDEIPALLYVAIAEIIAFAYLMTGKVPKHYQQD